MIEVNGLRLELTEAFLSDFDPRGLWKIRSSLRKLHMTQVEQIYTNERIAAVEEAEKEAKKVREPSAAALLREGDSVDKVSRCLGMPLREVKKLQARILDERNAEITSV